ncbi:MAG: hypothetical protein GY755_12020 [Chloroflexi bacterium]|nr:hypothetical protein [Chloroflexota bacterium]
MKKTSLFIKGMLTFNLLVFILTVGDFLALHDINKDYISSERLEALGISVTLPAWTAAAGEWQVVTISFIARSLFFLANLFLLWTLLKKEKVQ